MQKHAATLALNAANITVEYNDKLRNGRSYKWYSNEKTHAAFKVLQDAGFNVKLVQTTTKLERYGITLTTERVHVYNS